MSFRRQQEKSRSETLGPGFSLSFGAVAPQRSFVVEARHRIDVHRIACLVLDVHYQSGLLAAAIVYEHVAVGDDRLSQVVRYGDVEEVLFRVGHDVAGDVLCVRNVVLHLDVLLDFPRLERHAADGQRAGREVEVVSGQGDARRVHELGRYVGLDLFLE